MTGAEEERSVGIREWKAKDKEDSLGPLELPSKCERVETSRPRIGAREQPLDVQIMNPRRQVDERNGLAKVGSGRGFRDERGSVERRGKLAANGVKKVEGASRGVGGGV